MASAFRLVQFGEPQRLLTGIYHPPAGDGVRPAILLCKPFGPEAVRAHRLFRVLAERLARQGHPVLRFDYFGSGDSGGDDTEADLRGWAQDVRCADEALRQLSEVSDRVWMAARLGCVAAVHALRLDRVPAGVILWDPILDGSRYARELADMHKETVQRAFPLAQRRDLGVNGEGLAEVEGFALSEAMRQDIHGVSTQVFSAWDGKVPFACLAQAALAEDLRRCLAQHPQSEAIGLKIEVAPVKTDWAGSSGDGSIMVRPELVNALLRMAGGEA